MADESAEMRGKAIRVHLGVEGQSVRDHTAGSGVASEETTPVPAAESEAYSDGDWHESEGSLSENGERGPPSPIESVDGDALEVEVTVGAALAVHADISVAEVVTVSSEASNHENHEGNENDDGKVGESPEDLEVDTVSDHDVPAERVEPVEVEPEVERQISEEEVEVNEAEVDSPPTPVIRPEPGKHPGLDPVQDPSEVVVSEPEMSHDEHDLPVVQADGPEDEPSEPEEDPESPLAQTHGGYTSASHSYHSDSDDEEALQAELAVKEGEHDKLASQLQMMQQEMEALRRMLEQNQQELANSSKELEKARAELDDLRKQQNESAASSQAERDAFRQVDKLMKEKRSLREQLEKMQDQMQRMESLQQQLERRLQATEKERDAVKQRLQNESWKPHRIEEAEVARRRTGGEFRVLDKHIEKPARRPHREKPGAPKDVWRFQPRQRGALVLRVRPGLDSPRSNQKLFPGDSFVVSEQRKGPSDLVFLKLADGRGWAFNRSPDVGTLCVPRPTRKDRLAPYRLPEGVRLPGKIRQDQAIRSRPRLPAISKPVRDSRAPWH